MTPEELKLKESQELLDKVKSKVEEQTKELKEKVSTLETKSAEYLAKIEVLEKKGTSLKDVEDFKALAKEFSDMNIEVKALKEKGTKEVKSLSFKSQVLVGLEKSKDALNSLKDKKGSDINLELKAAGTMTTANVDAVGTDGISGLLTDIEAGITPIPRSQPFLMQLFPSSSTTGNSISYAEMKNPDGGAGMTAEGAAKTQADFDIVEAKVDVKKITSYIKTSKEALADIQALAGEINNELVTLIKLKADGQVLSGDGTGNNLKGILEYATAFNGGGLSSSIEYANNFDVLAAAVNQVFTAEVISGVCAGFMPNQIVINSTDFMKMKLEKDQNGSYLFPVMLPGISQVINVPIVVNCNMTEGEFLVGDFSKGNLRIREDININIGYENDDFTKNLVTILAEMRLAFYVKSNHTKAFVTGNFTTAIATLSSGIS